MDGQYPLAKHFEKASELVRVHGKSATNDDLSKFYGLFKQATIGDVNIDQPSFYQLTEKAKWASWNSNKGKSKDQAKHEYVEYVMKFFPEDIKAEFK
jgi:diazepam-binding inhibitor (GABA receptor modulating acyl-CoA-binding protein)